MWNPECSSLSSELNHSEVVCLITSTVIPQECYQNCCRGHKLYRYLSERKALEPESPELFCLHKLSKCPLLSHRDDAPVHKARLIKKWFSQLWVEEHSTQWSWTGTVIASHTISTSISLMFLWPTGSRILQQCSSTMSKAWNHRGFGMRCCITWAFKYFWPQHVAQ